MKHRSSFLTPLPKLRPLGAGGMLAILLASASTAPAAERIWDGGDANNITWTISQNWSNNVAPVAGDSLVFPHGAARRTNINNFAVNTTFSTITVSDGYNVIGNPLKLTGGLNASFGLFGSATFNPDITVFSEQQEWSGPGALGTFNVAGDLILDMDPPPSPIPPPLPSFPDLTLRVDGAMTLAGAITGTDAAIRKYGQGTVRVGGPGSAWDGYFVAEEGTLRIDASYPSAECLVFDGGIVAGSGRVLALTSGGGTISPGYASAPGVFHVQSDVQLMHHWTGTNSTFSVLLNGSAPGTGYDQLELNGELHITNCNLQVTLGAAVALSPGQNFTIINNLNDSQPVQGRFNGFQEGRHLVLDGNQLEISYTGGTGNDVVLTVVHVAGSTTSTWDGGGANAFWTTPENWWGNEAPQPGNSLVFPAIASQKANVNNFPAGTAFSNITFLGGGYSILGNRIKLVDDLSAYNSGSNVLATDLLLTNTQRFIIHSTLRCEGGVGGAGGVSKIGGGELILAGSGANTFQGGLNVSGGTVTLAKDVSVIAVPGPLVIGDTIDIDRVRLLNSHQLPDTAAITINGAGELALGGFVTDTIGPLTLNGGKVTGTFGAALILNSNLTVNPSPTTAGIQATLGLAGKTVSFDVSDGAAAPDLRVSGQVVNGALAKAGPGTMVLAGTNAYSGTTTVSAGTLLVNGNNRLSPVTLAGGTLCGEGVVGPITGNAGVAAPGDSLGTLRVSGDVTLSPATTFAVELIGSIPGFMYDQLSVTGAVNLAGAPLALSIGFVPSPGTAYLLLINDGNDPILGTFAGLPQGKAFQLGNNWFTISYTGDTGNDVVLMCVLPPAQLGGITELPGGQIHITGTGEPGANYTVEANHDLNTTNWVVIGTAVTGPNGVLQFIDSDAPNYSQRFYRFRWP